MLYLRQFYQPKPINTPWTINILSSGSPCRILTRLKTHTILNVGKVLRVRQ